ncbi:hypothetical protein [Bifidobacterium pseudolongum]|uniref:hypothetical protein n=1 Tax=Bifidobacterium pseudolongum TaxID=1694 RepID=UPI00101E947D|nr:hypothetical protein [Bifidobacterium pseudolongum]RYQ43026.1 hypothetical protein PG1805B_0232 [Bifidobacterium pseudolongum subsp. globosum]
MNNAELNRAPLHRYRNTFRAQDGEINKSTDDGLRAWAIRNVLASKMGPISDDELAALEDWEWETRLRIREVAALERIATALEAGHSEEEQAPKVMQGVGLDPEPTVDGDYVRKPSIELHRGLDGFGGVYRDENRGSWFALDLDQELRADSPEDLRDIAATFRDEFADALEWAADEWAAQLDAGEARLLEPESPANEIEDNETNMEVE